MAQGGGPVRCVGTITHYCPSAAIDPSFIVPVAANLAAASVAVPLPGAPFLPPPPPPPVSSISLPASMIADSRGRPYYIVFDEKLLQPQWVRAMPEEFDILLGPDEGAVREQRETRPISVSESAAADVDDSEDASAAAGSSSIGSGVVTSGAAIAAVEDQKSDVATSSTVADASSGCSCMMCGEGDPLLLFGNNNEDDDHDGDDAEAVDREDETVRGRSTRRQKSSGDKPHASDLPRNNTGLLQCVECR